MWISEKNKDARLRGHFAHEETRIFPNLWQEMSL
jgi:hypothetical protein